MSTTVELLKHLSDLNEQFRTKYSNSLYFNVLPCNKLPNKVKKTNRAFFCIINNQTHREAGEHWLAIFIQRNPKTNFRTAVYYDTYAEPVTWQHKKINTFLHNNSDRLIINRKRIQSDYSMNCGKFCLLFLLHMLKGGSLTTFNRQFSSRNLHANDKRIEAMYNDKFKRSLRIDSKRRGQFGGNLHNSTFATKNEFNQTCCARL